jgi:cyclopropane-fatty-acyl-phospholipid synthase
MLGHAFSVPQPSRRFHKRARDVALPPTSVSLADGSHWSNSELPAGIHIRSVNKRGDRALLSLDELLVGTAYVNGDIVIDGEPLIALRVRDILRDSHPFVALWQIYLKPLLCGRVRAEKSWIAYHYDLPPDFYYKFLDADHHCYSHGVYVNADDSLETAIHAKLSFAIDACRLTRSSRVLDVGGGWGAFMQFAGARGVNVTSITLSGTSFDVLQKRITERNLPCRARLTHLYAYPHSEQFDAIVNCGVTEHLPDYRRAAATYARLLRRGGILYLDASAAAKKRVFSTFTFTSIYPGNPTPMHLPSLVWELERHGLAIETVLDDTKSYQLTATHWATRFDSQESALRALVGDQRFRLFRLYLWGTVDAFRKHDLTAYRLVARRR